jgi:hypothetical protein
MKIIYMILVTLSIGLSSQALAWGFRDDFQKNVCHVPDVATAAKKCKNGNVLLFRPQMWGNEQLPIVISAAFCNYESPIVHNASGVSCIFTDIRKDSWSSLGLGGDN